MYSARGCNLSQIRKVRVADNPTRTGRTTAQRSQVSYFPESSSSAILRSFSFVIMQHAATHRVNGRVRSASRNDEFCVSFSIKLPHSRERIAHGLRITARIESLKSLLRRIGRKNQYRFEGEFLLRSGPREPNSTESKHFCDFQWM